MKIWSLLSLLAAAVIAAGTGSCRSGDNAEGRVERFYDFNDSQGWYFFKQDSSRTDNYEIADGLLSLRTRAGEKDRTKFHSRSWDFTTGTYTWRVLIPYIRPGERIVASMFLYHDNDHELDFEVGSGNEKLRRELGLRDGELVVYMISGYPNISTYDKISPGWHEFTITLEENYLGRYYAEWAVDGEVKQKAQLDYGPEKAFLIACGAEYLNTLGDSIPTRDYEVCVDYVKFTGEVNK